MHKQPSPMSLPIARLRAAGARVSTQTSHNPRGMRPWLAYNVTLPDGTVHDVRAPGHEYAVVVASLNALANQIGE